MRGERWDLFAALSGVVFAVLFLIGFALEDAGSLGANASTTEVVAHYGDSGTELKSEIGATLIGCSLFFLLLFLGSLRGALGRAEGECGAFTSAAYAGGVAMVSLIGTSAALQTAVASTEGFYESYEVDADTPLLVSTIALWTLGFAVVGGAVLVGGASLVAWKTGVLPRWLAIGGFVAAALGFFGETTAAFGVPVMLVTVWILVSSVILTRRRVTTSPA